MMKLAIYGIGALAVLASVGCATTKKGVADENKPGDSAAQVEAGADVSADPKAPLARRATDRWKLLIAGDATRAYDYLTPGYRETETLKQYDEWLRSRQIKWTSGQYMDHHCDEPTSCVVSVQIRAETKLPGIPGIQQAASVIEEQWLQLDGVWYHLPKRSR